ncbi:MAG: chorismate-binding protein [Prevotellaceae bacterium]|nr:chorismate-binding protein [Prevotellaceae bacterium]
MSNTVLYRLPHRDHYVRLVQHDGRPEHVAGVADLSGKSGFVFAPFVVNKDCPLLLLHPDERSEESVEEGSHKGQPLPGGHKGRPLPGSHKGRPLPGGHEGRVDDAGGHEMCVDDGEYSDYAIDYANFHAHLEDGEFQKIVLARRSRVALAPGTDAEALFFRACRLYPRLFIALVEMEDAGTWLMATPEVLLEGDGMEWHTMALAGTMRLEGEALKTEGEFTTWSAKNIQEQRYVATYITQCLEQFTDTFREEGPRTMRAADLVHLRSDFFFTLSDDRHLGDVLNRLHPTPAVCGLPKAATQAFILANEHAPRRYYSGFLGPLNPHEETHLFVSLRCMELHQDHADLYAGGGLITDSRLASEWQETENKLGTMRRVLVPLQGPSLVAARRRNAE